MEKHFLEGVVEGPQEFRAEPWYNADGDCVIYQTANEAVVAERIDEVLTVYRSAQDDRPIGFQIKGIKAIIEQFGLEGLGFHSETEGDKVTSVSVFALLLAAYESGPRTLGRRRAYAGVMEASPQPPPVRISQDELISA